MKKQAKFLISIQITLINNNKLTYGFAISEGRSLLYKLRNIDCCYLVSLNNIKDDFYKRRRLMEEMKKYKL